MPPVKVMMVDDSALVRRVIGGLLAEDPEIELVGTASNGQEALEKIPKLKPDVIVLDIEMPVRDGLSTLRELMKTYPLPVVMLSSHTRPGSQATLEALALGAVDFMPKPASTAEITAVVGELAAKVKAAASVPLRKILGVRQETVPQQPRKATAPAGGRRDLVVIGCSTGGPAALQVIIPALPADLPAAVVVVQHMPVGFTGPLSEHLARRASLRVKHAADGDLVLPGQVLVAPAGADFYFENDRSGQVKVKLVARRGRPAPGVFHPSVDGVMTAAAQCRGPKVLGVLLTGMGRDGALGMKEIKKRQGRTIAEAEESCVVFGMPKAAIELGVVDKVVPLPRIAAEIVNEV
ncbi:chemotaxis-specific protein-glutamate methyltransferase CheB [Thermodesulfitimonas autotrophica]|uniref:chemotaxis-specific protein-glutamate methyltransferase CheB n=1 Tax=Thermodesulfitimonas autotrophica TaxID=1894989 RepID=UPI002FE13F9E